ncbi:tail-specific protease Tsp [Candidatus Neptunichlamydia sp. REUL1]|uniref:tail-specific protease Tsp n=1 Tax=Candidatus Neptunichlamydia sp. REUL1 TaxID=3064277 RepID=UPI00293132DB|nr:S41 family peptidase [Candidatus Neptunochlamydia sp. REUL1]
MKEKVGIMGRVAFPRFIFLFIFISTAFASDPYTLSLQDVRSSMDKMFTYHVENKEFSPLIVKRSLKIYIEQFDPDRLYLLKGEVEPFLSLTPRQIRRVINDFQRDQYPEYWNLNFLIEKSIHRNQRIRHEEIERLIDGETEDFTLHVTTSYPNYSSTEQELRERVHNRLILELKAYMKGRKEVSLNPQLIQKILNHRSKKSISFESQYLNPTEHTLALHMLKAMAKSLDAHTGYYSPREAYEIRAALKKEFSGVGVVLCEDFDGVYISDVVKGGPAEKSGNIEVGDVLVAVNHQGIEKLVFEELLEVMKGQSGSKVTLGLKRNKTILHVDLIREKITMDDERLSIEFVPNGDGIIGKINVPAFYDNGGAVSLDRDLREALRTLKQEGELQGIVMDFRENSGGFLSQAVKVSSFFIQGGLIVISKYADGEVSYQRNIDGRRYFDGPLVILTSKASASAAEIVAQALQDYGVALIVGDERSYGKGSMQYQTITDERAKAFFKVTVGRYYTASGRSPQIQGVQADIVVPTIFFPYNIGERYLEFPLSNDHLSGDVFHSLMNIKQGSYRDVARFTVPYLKPRESGWRQMLPRLTANSQERIDQNQNFQFFLKVGNGYRPKKSRGQSRRDAQGENFGSNDLQMNEAVEIVRDMISISREKPLR